MPNVLFICTQGRPRYHAGKDVDLTMIRLIRVSRHDSLEQFYIVACCMPCIDFAQIPAIA
jgi:hypothetical protein